MRRLIYILLFLPFVLKAQYPTTNIDFAWNGSFDWSDSTLVDSLTGSSNANYKLIDVDFDTTGATYLTGKTSAKLITGGDTIAVDQIFVNQNYADTTFALWGSHTLNSDSTENLPFRITKIVHYSSKLTGSDSASAKSYFNVPTIAGSGVRWVGVGETYTTIMAAINAASANDTIYVKDGNYIEYVNATYALQIWKDVVIIGVGGVKILPRNSTYAVSFVSGSELYNCWIDDDSCNYTLRLLGNNDCSNLFVESVGTPAYLASGGTTIYKSYIQSNSTGLLIAGGFDFQENYFDFGGQTYGFGHTSNQGIINSTCNYNKITCTDMSDVYRLFWSGTTNIKYNSFQCENPTYCITNPNTTITGNLNIKGNTFDIDTCQGAIIYLHDNPDLNTIIRNNTIDCDTGNFSAIDLDSLGIVYVDSNTIDMYSKYGVSLIQQDTSFYINNNSISIRYTNNTTSNAYGIRISHPSSLETETNTINGNEVFLPQYFTGIKDSLSNSHAGIYYYALNGNIKYNKLFGQCISSLICKLNGYGNSNDSTIVSYNIADGQLMSKGASNVWYYNNTCQGFIIIENADDSSGYFGSTANILKNNIVYRDADSWGSYHIQLDQFSDTSFVSNNNIIYDGSAMRYKGTTYNFTQWKVFGYDVNSFNTDPNFYSTTNKQFWPVSPSNAIGKGANLGTSYNTGLDITASWPSSIVTKTQVAPWTIGAYVIEYLGGKGIRGITPIKGIR